MWTTRGRYLRASFRNPSTTSEYTANSVFLSDYFISSHAFPISRAVLAYFEIHRQVSQQKRRLSWRATKAALLITLYHSEPIFQLPFQILTLLQDLDELMTTWRTRHGRLPDAFRIFCLL